MTLPMDDTRRPVRRLVAVVAALAVAGTMLGLTGTGSATGDAFPAPTPQAECGPGARPETTPRQGRVPTSDYESGRAARGYECNTEQVARHGQTGGFKVQRYRDAQGNVCAFYDSTLLFPKDTLFNAARGLGVYVLNMNDPSRPRQTATLSSPAMDSPHESVLVNRRRGLLGAVLGNAATNAGVLDLYDIKSDCRHPELLSSTPTAVLGHESGWAPDGRTFWASSSGGQTLTAIDVSDPRVPRPVFFQSGVNYHGLRLSDDGRTMYVAEIGNPTDGSFASGGLRILDVSEVQDREPNPQVRIISELDWPERSIPQVAEPFTRNGHPYLLEVDEFANYNFTSGQDQSDAPVGAARIIDIADPENPVVVSHLRLEVHQPAARESSQQNDPGARSPVQGYAGHYCSVPRRTDPKLVACSMILSGLRVFDISDLRSPVEVGYFNRPLTEQQPLNPTAEGAYAMSQPAWDVGRRQIWYSDGNTGFYAVRLTNGVGALLR
jgi:hypothetical protein